MQIEDAYTLVLCGVHINEIPIPECYAETISRFRQFEAWDEPIDEIHRVSKIDKRHIKKLKRAYDEVRKGIIFGKELAIGYEAAGPVKQRKNMKQVRHQAQSARIWEISTRKVICYGF